MGAVRACAQQRPGRAGAAFAMARAVPLDGRVALVEPRGAARLELRPERHGRLLRRDRDRVDRVQPPLPSPRSDLPADRGDRAAGRLPHAAHGLEPGARGAARPAAAHRPDPHRRSARLRGTRPRAAGAGCGLRPTQCGRGAAPAAHIREPLRGRARPLDRFGCSERGDCLDHRHVQRGGRVHAGRRAGQRRAAGTSSPAAGPAGARPTPRLRAGCGL